jgi:hypothetical protein
MRTVTIIGLLAYCAALVACGGSNGVDVRDLLRRSAEVMQSESFSFSATGALSPPPIVWEYAPPDRIKLSNPQGHDDWPYYLVVGDQWMFSQEGERWLDGNDYNFPFMLLSDPRVLLRTADGPRTDGTEDVSGVLHHVVRADVDAERFIGEELPPQALPDTPEGDQARAFYKDFVASSEVRFWINAESYTVTKMEIDYPPLPEDEDGDDPQPAAITFNYKTAVDVPEDPESMPQEEAQRLRREAQTRTAPLQQAISDYKELYGTYPPSLDPETLSEVLPPSQWPVNAFTGEPVKESVDSPGDFHYVPKNEGRDFELSLFDWDSTYSYTDTVRFGHPEDYEQ